MIKHSKRNLLLMTGLAGSLVAASAAGVALSSCTTTSSSTTDVQYSDVIDWSNPDIVNRLTIDDQGLIYSSTAKTNIIGIVPNVVVSTIKIPSTVTSITGYRQVVTDSNGVKTYQVTGAFEGFELLETLVIPTGSKLESIGAYAFRNCTNLKTISGLSNSLTFVGDAAFNGCSSLTNIDLSNVVSIGALSFYGCSSLTDINANSAVVIGQNAFQSCTSLQTFSATSLLTISNNMLLYCSALTTATFKNVTTVGVYSFGNCSSLTTVSGLENVTVLGTYAFQNCTSLTSISSLENLKVMGQYAFYNATKEGANITLKLTNLTSVPKSGFQNATGIQKIDLSDNTVITSLGDSSFYGSAIQEIDLTGCSSLTLIDQNAFDGCTSLTTVYLPSNDISKLATIGYYAFHGCTNLTTIAPKAANKTGFVSTANITTIGATAFSNSGIRSIDLTNFKGITSSGVTTTGSALSFAEIPYLESVTLSNNLTRLDASSGKGLFYGSGLEGNGFDIVLPSSITEINVSGGASAFTNSGVKSIDASKITSYWSDDRSETILTNTYSNLTKLEKIILKPGTTTIQATAFNNVPALQTVVIPSAADSDVSTVTGFKGSSTLTTIGTGNFVTTSLATVDLTDLTSATITSISGSFTNLPANAVAKLPSTYTSTLNSASFTIAKTDETASTTYATIQYPNGLTVPANNISTGKLTNTTFLSNISGALDLSSNTTITSVGENTFFGTSLESLTLPASGISSANIFSTATTITANTVNTAATAYYTKANAPFGSNASLTGLNYTGFTTTTGTVTDAASLFNTTSADTWTQVAKIINSLSYQASPSTEDAAKALKPNMSTWTADTTQSATSTISNDSVATWTAATTGSAAKPAQIALSNAYESTTAETNSVTITAATTTATIVHNGVTWTYTNDGTNITLTASNVNMYKLTSTASGTPSYLTFFNESTWKASDSATTTYYVPATQSVNVTLTIATASSSTL